MKYTIASAKYAFWHLLADISLRILKHMATLFDFCDFCIKKMDEAIATQREYIDELKRGDE